MSGVNDLANQWRNMLNRTDAGYYSMTVCAGELEELARTAWHPISDTPTDADGDEWGRVLIKCGNNIQTVTAQHGADACVEGMVDCWARINDVVLLPEDK